jgi:addiction module toxin, RelE/StbE family
MHVLQCLVTGEKLEIKHRPHKLTGNYNGYMECHIKPDVLLIYQITDDELYLYRIGSHSSLF